MSDPGSNLKNILDGIGPLREADILEKLAGGPASDSWLLAVGDERFVARIDMPFARLLGLDRYAEIEVLRTVSTAGIGPQLISADPEKGLLVTSYLPGSAWSFMDVHKLGRLEALARTLLQLHSLAPCGPVFAPGKMAQIYAREVGSESAFEIAQQAAKLAKRLLSETRRPALCHNDLVHSNIIGCKRVQLIDWEYAAVGDPYFDLAIVVRHHQLSANCVEHFLNAYFESPGKEHFSRLETFCRLYDQLAALWYLLVVSQTGHDELYDEELKQVMARLAEPLI